MIHKIIQGRPSGGATLGLIKYVLDKRVKDETAELVGGNMMGRYASELNREMQSFLQINPNIKEPTFHAVISLPDGEKLTNEQWQTVTEAYLKKLGFDTDKNPYLIVKHTNTDNQHVHIVASRIDFDGHCVGLQNDRYKGMEVMREYEKVFGLRVDKKTPKNEQKKARPDTAEKGKAARKNQKITGIEYVQNAIDSVLAENVLDLNTKDGQDFFTELLKEMGITAQLIVQNKGLTGASFRYDGVSYKGTKLGANYKAKKLVERGLSLTGKSQGYLKNQERDSMLQYSQPTRAAALRAQAPAMPPPINAEKPTPYSQSLEKAWDDFVISIAPQWLKKLLILFQRLKRAKEQKEREAYKEKMLYLCPLPSATAFNENAKAWEFFLNKVEQNFAELAKRAAVTPQDAAEIQAAKDESTEMAQTTPVPAQAQARAEIPIEPAKLPAEKQPEKTGDDELDDYIANFHRQMNELAEIERAKRAAEAESAEPASEQTQAPPPIEPITTEKKTFTMRMFIPADENQQEQEIIAPPAQARAALTDDEIAKHFYALTGKLQTSFIRSVVSEVLEFNKREQFENTIKANPQSLYAPRDFEKYNAASELIFGENENADSDIAQILTKLENAGIKTAYIPKTDYDSAIFNAVNNKLAQPIERVFENGKGDEIDALTVEKVKERTKELAAEQVKERFGERLTRVESAIKTIRAQFPDKAIILTCTKNTQEIAKACKEQGILSVQKDSDEFKKLLEKPNDLYQKAKNALDSKLATQRASVKVNADIATEQKQQAERAERVAEQKERTKSRGR